MTRPHGDRVEGGRPEPVSRRDQVDWVQIGGALFWLLAVFAAVPVGVIVGSIGLYFSVGLISFFVDAPPADAMTATFLVGTPCLLVALTFWATLSWARRHAKTRNGQRHP